MTKLVALFALGVAACGGSAPGTDPGGGSGTLLVAATVSFDQGDTGAEIRVAVSKQGAAVTDAEVTIDSDIGSVVVPFDAGENVYRAVQPGWGDYYVLSVQAGDDHLSGSINAPAEVTITEPDPASGFDPHTVEGGVVDVRWSGSTADTVKVKTKSFEYEGPDEGHIGVPATVFEDESQDLSVERKSSTPLAGGVAGSRLSAEHKDEVTLIVINPF